MTEPIYFDATSLFQPKLTGVGRYIARLIERVAKKQPVRLVSLLPREHAYKFRPKAKLDNTNEVHLAPDTVPVDTGDLHAWRDAVLERPTVPHKPEEAIKNPGVHTFLRGEGPRRFRREVAILYDFTPLVVSDTHTPDMVRDFASFCTNHMPKFDAALAISESTGYDAEWICGIEPERLAVAYPGPSQCLHEHAWNKPVVRRDDFALVVSTLEPRKNGRFLMDWFLTTKALPENFELWWAGPRGWMGGVGEVPTDNPFGRRVRFLGMLSDAELCHVYQTARFSIYASLYEGFGFPVLDSLRHGTRVMCAFNSSLCEFGGEGVHFFDACDTASADAACTELLTAKTPSVSRPDLDDCCDWDLAAERLIDLCQRQDVVSLS